MFVYGRKSINGSGTGVAWTENIFVPNSRLGDGRGYKRWASATLSRPRFGGRSVPWRGVVPFCLNCVPSSPENARARAPHISYVCLQEKRLARAQDGSSALWEGESLKPTNFGVFPKTELLAKFTLSHGLTSSTSAETISTPLTPLK